MAVNFLLTDARQVRDDDPLGRSWVGWASTATDDQLWEVNRGLWILGDRIAGERIATLSYDGLIQVVVEVTGRRRYDVDGQPKWALSGNVLRPGDPVHDQLKGSPTPRHRNPVSYFDTSVLESLSSVERARFAGRNRVTMVVTWNPDKWNPDDWATQVYPQDVKAVTAGGLLRGQWATGNRTLASSRAIGSSSCVKAWSRGASSAAGPPRAESSPTRTGTTSGQTVTPTTC